MEVIWRISRGSLRKGAVAHSASQIVPERSVEVKKSMTVEKSPWGVSFSRRQKPGNWNRFCAEDRERRKIGGKQMSVCEKQARALSRSQSESLRRSTLRGRPFARQCERESVSLEQGPNLIATVRLEASGFEKRSPWDVIALGCHRLEMSSRSGATDLFPGAQFTTDFSVGLGR